MKLGILHFAEVNLTMPVARGNPLPNDPGAFVIPMNRVVGTGGETSIKIITRPGTNEIITAYPIK